METAEVEEAGQVKPEGAEEAEVHLPLRVIHSGIVTTIRPTETIPDSGQMSQGRRNTSLQRLVVLTQARSDGE